MKIAPRLVLCSGARVSPNDPLRAGRKVIELDALKRDSNTRLLLENVTDAFAQHLEPRMVDLLELATYVYTADCAVSREQAWIDDKSTEPWSRDFHLVMPVRDLAFWNRDDVRDGLIDALDYLSSDQFGITFCELKEGREVSKYLKIENVEDKPFYSIERVTMFSGGLDSLAGAVECAERGESLVLVSHRSAPQINRRQIALVKKLKEKFPVPIMHIPVWVNKSGFHRESTQRTRTFLFSALGVAVASVLKAKGVRFYENGVISLNWPLADEALRSRASRSTHPKSLLRLQELYRLVTDDTGFAVDNPYVFKTKTEVVSLINERCASDLIEHSCSCVHTMFQPKTQWHCGRCGQCIDRRIAILAAGLEAFDSEDDYVSDVFTGPRPVNPERPYDHNIAVNYARFVNDLNGMSEQDLAIGYNPELTRAASCFPDVGGTAMKLIDMHKRHAQAACQVLGSQLKLHSGRFLDGSLDQTSLLAMIGRSEHVGSAQQRVAEVPKQAARNGNVIRRVGDYWMIVYDGKETLIRDCKGMRYLAFLVENPDKPFLALHLVMHDNGELPEPDPVYSSMSAEELRDEDLDSIGFPEDKVENARSSVSHAIGGVLRKLKISHPAFYDHFRASYTPGCQVSYRPNSPIDWQF